MSNALPNLSDSAAHYLGRDLVPPRRDSYNRVWAYSLGKVIFDGAQAVWETSKARTGTASVERYFDEEGWEQADCRFRAALEGRLQEFYHDLLVSTDMLEHPQARALLQFVRDHVVGRSPAQASDLARFETAFRDLAHLQHRSNRAL